MCPPRQDPVLTVLRGHLLTEHYIEQILQLALPKGERLTGDAGLSYAQKLAVIEALDILEDRTIAALRGLNRIRNRCAHEKERVVTIADIDIVGRPLGDDYTKARREYQSRVKDLLHDTIALICSHLTAEVFDLEESAIERADDLTGRRQGETPEQ